MLVESVTEARTLHALAARSVFWECAEPVADPAFEKEAWITTTSLSFGDCGYTVGDEATIFFCPPDLAPGAAQLPTAPVSPDAALVSSLFIKQSRASSELSAVLLDASIMNLTSREFPAVEVFGYRDHRAAQELLGRKPGRIGLAPIEVLESAGFKVTEDHPAIPRLRLELPPAFDLLTAAAVDDILARALA